MRKILLFILVVVCFSACKDDRTELFRIEIETDFVIDASLNTILTHYFPINNVQTNYSTFAGQTNLDAIGSIRSMNCSLTSIFTPVNYEFIQEISVFAIDPADSSVRKELFYLDPNPLGNGTENELTLFGTLSDHKELLSQDVIHLEVRIQLRYNAPTTFDNRMVLTFQAFDTE